jgi:hypothetical protein
MLAAARKKRLRPYMTLIMTYMTLNASQGLIYYLEMLFQAHIAIVPDTLISLRKQ